MKILIVFLLAVLLCGCQSAAAGTGPIETDLPGQTDEPAPTAASEETPLSTPSAAPTPRAKGPMVWLSPALPKNFVEALKLPAGLDVTKDEAEATVRLEVLKPTNQGAERAVTWVYALAVPFPTVTDEVTLSDLHDLWRGSPPEGFNIHTLLMDSSTELIFESLWGRPAGTVRLRSAHQLLDEAWDAPGIAAILPFEQLEPRWKALAVDGQSPVRKDFKPDDYALSVRLGWQGETATRQEAGVTLPLVESNRDPEQLSTVVITGVTALVRGTGSFMERYGNTYPAQDIGPWLREADILHINNEVPFAKNCPLPHNWEGLVFCSRPKYIELLEDVGADVIELAGDHFQDWGADAMLYTLEMYNERGWQYYGGGTNLEEARQAARFEHNGNRVAFIGCNAKPPGYATASETNPGAAHCDFDRLTADVQKLREEGYLPIVTFQHLEYYSYDAHPILEADFKRMAEAGAVIVSGSQAHQPHAMAFEDSAFLHYGLGNLFFDQTNQGDAPRTAFIDRHVFYRGQHISTELLTIYLVDYARSRPMTDAERAALLEVVFEASGWKQ